jgi:hypothetical protein
VSAVTNDVLSEYEYFYPDGNSYTPSALVGLSVFGVTE